MANGRPRKPRNPVDQLANAIKNIRSNQECDIIFYSGAMDHPGCPMLYDMLKGIRRPQKNVMLFLTTFGGMADEAYRIARCLQDRYSGGRFTLFIDTYCKSAGTLLALGAHELVMSDLAELGPIDVQIFKKDDTERTSGLTNIQALANLET